MEAWAVGRGASNLKIGPHTFESSHTRFHAFLTMCAVFHQSAVLRREMTSNRNEKALASLPFFSVSSCNLRGSAARIPESKKIIHVANDPRHVASPVPRVGNLNCVRSGVKISTQTPSPSEFRRRDAEDGEDGERACLSAERRNEKLAITRP